MTESRNLWGGRFTGQADVRFVEFNRSFDFDKRLFEADVRASIAHCNGLLSAGVLSLEEADAIRAGLAQILESARSEPEYLNDPSAEDIHSFVESRLVKLIG